MVIGLLFLILCNTTSARVVAPPNARPKITIPTVDYIEEQRKGFDLSLDIITRDIADGNGDPANRKQSFAASFGPTIERFEQWVQNPGVFPTPEARKSAAETLGYMRQQQQKFEALADGHSRPQPLSAEPNGPRKSAEQLLEEHQRRLQPQKRNLTWLIPTAIIAGGVYWFTRKTIIARKRKPQSRMLKACDS